jgi:formate hydrogenlyase subunit 6/NADH:ubiquinone oxidoreductase subunit I
MAKNPLVKVAREMLREPSTLEFPEQKAGMADNYRGMEKLDIGTCVSCSACSLICPNSTITMVDTETVRGTKKMPEINIERCLFCGLCAEVCPTGCLTMTKNCDFERYDRRGFIKRPEELK